MKIITARNAIISGLVVLPLAGWFFTTRSKPVDFSADVKPILNKKCIACHGGVKKQAGFSLLFRDEALAPTKSGKPAIVPGDPDASEMIRRLTLTDPEERMPYKHEPLSAHEMAVLKAWVKQGAKWGEHWAYVPVKPVAVPKESSSLFGFFGGSKEDWGTNDVDKFIYQKLKENGLSPSPEADKPALLRRASMDIIGLPAKESTTQTFLKSADANAYETYVDSLLASPHFGERWAAVWLDLARYADTKGYERDDGRSIWKYRDWLIQSFNEDKRYDKFLIEQLAGDLLPDATDDQLIATAFHRNTMTNDEGGTDNEEFRTAAVMDRVNTTWQALMGTTFACVQCHSHPYDPFRHEEYYKFMAFFNNTRDEDTYADYPVLRQYSKEDSLKLVSVVNWVKENSGKDEAKRTEAFLKTGQPSYNSLTATQFVNCELSDTKWLAMRAGSSARLQNVDLEKKSKLIYRYSAPVLGGSLSVRMDRLDGPLLFTTKVDTSKGWKITEANFNESKGMHDIYFIYSNASLKDPKTNGLQFDWFYFTQPLAGKEKGGYAVINKSFWDVLTAKNVTTTPVKADNPDNLFRKTYVFNRGNWLVKGAEVQADVPQSLGGLQKGQPRNRLGLAMWLTDKSNPLTARTMVNRLWEQLFGTGLVETLEDMGTQGAEPTHKELLDYLSYKFMNEYNWSVKKLLREIVMSAAYKQASKASSEALAKDPFNKYYGRGPRVRLSAEQIRDEALQVSGLLSEKMFGAPVMPWQPQGIWLSPWNGGTWKKSGGEDQYRRTIYTYWKRTAPYPSVISFDGVGREVCTARRIRTNTPLQALVTLNDSVYLEAARFFAYRIQKETASSNVDDWISKGYTMMMQKPIAPAKLSALRNLYTKAYEGFKNDKSKTCEMNGMDDSHNNPETASLIVVANALLNMDEWITKG